jgi:hypothetical protein
MRVPFRGDYRGCDLPYWTAVAIVQYIAAVEKVIVEILLVFLASDQYVSILEY